jgi:hypothetical protein
LNAQRPILDALVGLPFMLLAGFVGAVFLNWASLVLESRKIDYWHAYRVSTFGGMAVVVLLVPVQVLGYRWGVGSYVVDLVASTVLMGVVIGHWISDGADQPIGFGRGLWLSVVQTAYVLLLVAIVYGLSEMLVPSHMALGATIAVACTGLLYFGAFAATRKDTGAKVPLAEDPLGLAPAQDDYVALYAYAEQEFDEGHIQEVIWLKAQSFRADAQAQREWYLAARVQELREIAESQLRREKSTSPGS